MPKEASSKLQEISALISILRPSSVQEGDLAIVNKTILRALLLEVPSSVISSFLEKAGQQDVTNDARFGRWLSDVRKDVGLTQAAFAKRIGLAQGCVSELENLVNPRSEKRHSKRRPFSENRRLKIRERVEKEFPEVAKDILRRVR